MPIFFISKIYSSKQNQAVPQVKFSLKQDHLKVKKKSEILQAVLLLGFFSFWGQVI